MNYDPSHIMNPGPGAAARLMNYVSQNGHARVLSPRGMPVGDDELRRFRALVSESESSAMHSFAFAEKHDPDELVDSIREPLATHLDGNYLVGVHSDTGKPHLHIAECGSRDDLYLPASKIAEFAPAIAESVGETIEIEVGD